MDKARCMLAIIIAITILAMSSPTLTYAQPPAVVNIYAWTDKTNYDPGEKGTLKIVIRNDRTDEDLILYNITITYPWFAYTGEKWEGNDTIAISPPVTLEKNGGCITYTRDFTVPSDGRALSMYATPGSIAIRVNVDKSPYHYDKTAYIYVKSMPLFMSLEDGDKAITLFTILVVLVIVCTIILAAVIFLSVRRPQVVWKAEEKAE